MPARNRLKIYEAEAYYHIYNRGVAKRPVFIDNQDYNVFISYLRTYLLPKDTDLLMKTITSSMSSSKEKDTARKLLRMNNFFDTVNLLAYCLMSNHFHLLIFQKEADKIDQMMNSLGTRYAMYFNKKYKRVGPLFQGVYKAVRITSEEQLIYLSKYIHRNPNHGDDEQYRTYQYSSYLVYSGQQHAAWVKNGPILDIISQTHQHKKYQDFVNETVDGEKMAITLRDVVEEI